MSSGIRVVLFLAVVVEFGVLFATLIPMATEPSLPRVAAYVVLVEIPLIAAIVVTAQLLGELGGPNL